MSFPNWCNNILSIFFLHFDPQNQPMLLKCQQAPICSSVEVMVHLGGEGEKDGDSVLRWQPATGGKVKGDYDEIDHRSQGDG